MSEREEGNAGEDRHERTARELIELLQELRIVIPGVQVLFAFLLTVPFSQGFTKLDSLQRGVFFATLLCTAATTALLIAPSSHHRVQGGSIPSSSASPRRTSRNAGWAGVVVPSAGSSAALTRASQSISNR